MTRPFSVPGDKSISHRALILGALADGPSVLEGVPASGDVESTRSALASLGADSTRGGEGRIAVAGAASWRSPREAIDCGNSGTTARLLLGLLVGLGRGARLDGDESLRRRPMDRVVYPLQAMGGKLSWIGSRDRLPVLVEPRASGALRVLRYRSRVASAQVKSSLLLAALSSGTEVEVREPAVTRDHTERMLAALGAPIEFGPIPDGGARAALQGRADPPGIPGFQLQVPGDLSSAAFLVVAALLAELPVRIEAVGLNPTRTGFLDRLRAMGADLEVRVLEHRLGEPVGFIDVRPSGLRPLEIVAETAPACIDEIPVLAVLAARVPGVSRIRGASELRVKESDRLARIGSGLRDLGVACDEGPDGLTIEGTDRALKGTVRTAGDHRVAMAFAVLGCAPGCEIEVDDPACVDISYPGFWSDLRRLVGGDEP